MKEFWILILVPFFATNSPDKAESVQLEETPLKIIDEIFGEGWWDKDKDEEWNKLTLEQNALHQIDRQDTQIGQIEPNSTDQNLDHSDNAQNGKEQSEIMKEITSYKNINEDERKRNIINKFVAMKDKFKQKEKYSAKEWTQIEKKIAQHLKVNRTKVYKWKKEFGLNQKMSYEKEERKHLIEKFDQMKAELKRAGFKNSYKEEMDKTVAKKLGLNLRTIYDWKCKLGQTKPQHKYAHSEQKDLMKHYYEIKDKNPKIKDEDIAKRLKIGGRTLARWKSQFKR